MQDTIKYDRDVFLLSPKQIILGEVHKQYSQLLASAIESIRTPDHHPRTIIYHLTIFGQLLSI